MKQFLLFMIFSLNVHLYADLDIHVYEVDDDAGSPCLVVCDQSAYANIFAARDAEELVGQELKSLLQVVQRKESTFKAVPVIVGHDSSLAKTVDTVLLALAGLEYKFGNLIINIKVHEREQIKNVLIKITDAFGWEFDSEVLNLELVQHDFVNDVMAALQEQFDLFTSHGGLKNNRDIISDIPLHRRQYISEQAMNFLPEGCSKNDFFRTVKILGAYDVQGIDSVQIIELLGKLKGFNLKQDGAEVLERISYVNYSRVGRIQVLPFDMLKRIVLAGCSVVTQCGDELMSYPDLFKSIGCQDPEKAGKIIVALHRSGLQWFLPMDIIKVFGNVKDDEGNNLEFRELDARIQTLAICFRDLGIKGLVENRFSRDDLEYALGNFLPLNSVHIIAVKDTVKKLFGVSLENETKNALVVMQNLTKFTIGGCNNFTQQANKLRSDQFILMVFYLSRCTSIEECRRVVDLTLSLKDLGYNQDYAVQTFFRRFIIMEQEDREPLVDFLITHNVTAEKFARFIGEADEIKSEAPTLRKEEKVGKRWVREEISKTREQIWEEALTKI